MRYAALCLALLLPSGTNADEVRIELGHGQCKHRLAEDTSWYYGLGGYRVDMTLYPKCHQIGILWKPKDWLGVRLAYVDLGTITANNSYPDPESAYMDAKRNRTAIDAKTRYYYGVGTDRGATLGPVLEQKVSHVTIGAELGVAFLYHTWHATVPGFKTWDYADGHNFTPYLGATVRWKWLQAGLRVYHNVHASNADENPQYIGPTAGPLRQWTIGLSIPIQ